MGMTGKLKEESERGQGFPSAYSRRWQYWKDVSEEEWNDWKWQLRNSIRSAGQLGKIFPLTEKEAQAVAEVEKVYPLWITPHYLSLIDPNDPADPVRLQAIPQEAEIIYGSELPEDPLEEEVDAPVAGLTHRYPDRVLMILTDFCSTYCRHCTRKRLFRKDVARKAYPLEPMLQYLRSHKKVREVILSGGDPLTYSNSRLEEIFRKLRQIPHIEIIRLGSRVPVTLPQRLFDEDL
ncbi:MAG: KamA family radical SAM protein, partial [bacterium]